MSDRIARIFVDSNYRTNVEDPHGNFSIDLPLGVIVEAGSHLRVEGLVVSHVWPTLDVRNSFIFLREEVEEGTSYHRIVALDDGNYNISTLAVELQKQLRSNSYITDGFWSVASSDEGLLTISQSSPTFQRALIYSASDVAGKTSVDINWQFVEGYVATSTSWPQVWAAANVTGPLPAGGDASTLIGIPVRRMSFSQTASSRQTGHVNLARHRVLHLFSSDLPQTSLSPHGRTDVVASLIVAGSAPGSLIHNGFASPPDMYCANSRQLHHLRLQVRDQADQIVHLPHAIHFELVVTRPYE